jgi:hypothetical protein
VWNLEIIDQLLVPLSFQSNDNLLSASTPHLSANGLSFTTTEDIYNIAYSGSFSFYTANNPVSSIAASAASPLPWFPRSPRPRC